MREKYRINNIDAPLDAGIEKLKKILAEKINTDSKNIKDFKIAKKSVDARNKSNIHFVYSFDFNLSQTEEIPNGAIILPHDELPPLKTDRKIINRPVIIGSGPAGMFAGLALAEAGLRPVIIERGEIVESRHKSILTFFEKGKLKTSSNIQFGEGGAGTFSDGKLMTGIKKDAFMSKVFAELTEAGAPPEINYLAKPHIGTDNLRIIVANIRKKIISLGGEYRFNTLMTDIIIKDDHITGIKTECNGKTNEIETDKVILAIGHSSRDTFEKLYKANVQMEQKAFAVGFRIEHLQKNINRAQYGKENINPLLPVADYKMAVHFKEGRSAFTFCMCPGGVVVGAASEERRIVTNGMSEFKRNGINANAALLAEVGHNDFKSNHPLAGMYFQQEIEEKAFREGGENYSAPCELVGNFLKDAPSLSFGEVIPTYLPGTVFGKIKNIFSENITNTLKKAICEMDKKLHGFAAYDAVITAPETRSSSPVRIIRDKSMQSNIKGLYPCGEGAGYAGGITSSAVDGLKVAYAMYTG